MANRTQLSGYSGALGVALLLVLPANAQKPTVELNGGMTAQLLSLSRDAENGRPGITATVKITNTGKDYVFLVFTGAPSGVDDAGVAFQGSVSGVGWCRKDAPQCIGNPSAYYAFPLQQYTEIDPGTSTTAIFRLPISSRASTTRSITLSSEMAYRLVSDLARDADLSTSQKLQQVRMGNLGFDPVTVTDCIDCGGAGSTAGGFARSNPVPIIPPTRQWVAPVPESHTAPRPDMATPGIGDAIGERITSVVNDKNAGQIFTGERLVLAFIVGFFLLLLWHNAREYWGTQKHGGTRELNAFAKSAAWVILVGGVAAWFGYFGDHHAFFAWPILVFVVFTGVLIWRGLAEDRHKREYAESLQEVDHTPVFGDAEEATPDDERRAGL